MQWDWLVAVSGSRKSRAFAHRGDDAGRVEEDGRRRPLGRHEIATGAVTAEVHVVNADGATVEVRNVPTRDLRQARFNVIPKARREGEGAAPRIVFSRLGYG